MTFRSTNDLEIRIHSDLNEINSNDWHEIVSPNQLFLQFPYLQSLLDSSPEAMRFYFVIAYLHEKPVWVGCFQLYEFSADSIQHEIEQKEDSDCLLDKVRHNVGYLFINSMKRKKFRVLICGQSFVSGDYGFSFSPEINEALALKILHKATFKVAKAEKAHAIVAKDFIKERTSTFSLKELGYHSFSVEPNMVLNVAQNWFTFEDYMASMSTKYRTRAKSAFNKSATIECRALSYEEIVQYKDQIYALYHDVHERADFKIGVADKSYFQTLKKNMPDEFFINAYFLGEKLVSFASYFVWKNFMEAHFIGFENDLNHQYLLYQRILYDYVKVGINFRVQKIYFGRTALEIKSTIGAVAEDLISYVKLRNRISNKCIKPVFDYIKPVEWTPRSPFKEVSVQNEMQEVEKN